jgi:hypothetical protein
VKSAQVGSWFLFKSAAKTASIPAIPNFTLKRNEPSRGNATSQLQSEPVAEVGFKTDSAVAFIDEL